MKPSKFFFLLLLTTITAVNMITPAYAGSITFHDLSNQMGMQVYVYAYNGTLIGIYEPTDTILNLYNEHNANDSYIFQFVPSRTDYYARNSTALFGLIDVSLPVGFNIILVVGLAIGILGVVIYGLVLWIRGR